MKLPLKYGIPLLIVLWLASGYTAYGEGKTLLMMLAMGVALWTAFSLPRPRRRPPREPEEEGEEPWDEGEDAGRGAEPPANGSGRRPPGDARDSDRP
jgi:hypothetical protein